MPAGWNQNFAFHSLLVKKLHAHTPAPSWNSASQWPNLFSATKPSLHPNQKLRTHCAPVAGVHHHGNFRSCARRAGGTSTRDTIVLSINHSTHDANTIDHVNEQKEKPTIGIPTRVIGQFTDTCTPQSRLRVEGLSLKVVCRAWAVTHKVENTWTTKVLIR